MKYFILFSLSLFLFSCKNPEVIKNNVQIIENDDWGKEFKSAELEGTFVLTKLNSDSLNVFNVSRSGEGFLPASTFKIINSMISLETEVIKDEKEIIKWDGKKRFYDKWNSDQNLASAIKYSCVWFYQELARRIGRERMQGYLDSTSYGNSKIGEKIDTFWLEGDLRISAIEQIKFLTKFLNKDLPFTDRNMEISKNILLVESTEFSKLYAKTGWTARVEKDKQIGWYVGFVEKENDTWIFAMNIDFYKSESAKFREAISRKILKVEGLIN